MYNSERLQITSRLLSDLTVHLLYFCLFPRIKAYVLNIARVEDTLLKPMSYHETLSILLEAGKYLVGRLPQ